MIITSYYNSIIIILYLFGPDKETCSGCSVLKGFFATVKGDFHYTNDLIECFDHARDHMVACRLGLVGGAHDVRLGGGNEQWRALLHGFRGVEKSLLERWLSELLRT